MMKIDAKISFEVLCFHFQNTVFFSMFSSLIESLQILFAFESDLFCQPLILKDTIKNEELRLQYIFQ